VDQAINDRDFCGGVIVDVQKGPLSGYLVIDFSQAASGPFCTQILSDLGARVIKVEPPEGDMIRGWHDITVRGHGTYFMGLNRGKESICLNLKTEPGLRIAHELIRRADVVVENYRPGVADRLGIGYETAKRLNERVVYVSISGYGPLGPRAQDPAMDIIIQAVGGIMGITGEPGRPPVKVGAPIADLVTGWAACAAVLAALLVRAERGIGQYVHVAMLDVVISLLSNHATGFLMTGKTPGRMGSGHPQLVPYQAFETRDREYIIVGVLNEGFWRKFCEAIGRTEWLDDPRFKDNAARVRHREQLIPLIEEIIREKTKDEWISHFREFDVPVAPVMSFEALFSDEQVRVNRMVREVYHEKVGAIKVLGPPLRFEVTPADVSSPPPLLGEHTARVLLELGYSDAEITALEEAGVVKVGSR
jgi:formyl-CoA transferase/CoA:oxalate CoA-transferase